MATLESLGHLAWAVLRAAVAIYAVLLLAMAGCQRTFIYFPGRASEAELRVLADRAGFEPWRDGHGVFHGWRQVAEASPGTTTEAIVVFHGNAGHALDRTYYADGFGSAPAPGDRQVHLFEYPGYGARAGGPSEQAIRAAADSALADLIADGRRIFLVGESLGSGVACWLAGRHPETVAGLLLVTPFTSLIDVGQRHYPIVPVRLLLRERFDNVAALTAYRGPVAFLLAGRDEVVPSDLGRRLHDGYRGPKLLLVEPGKSHNTLMGDPRAPWWRAVVEFWSGSAGLAE